MNLKDVLAAKGHRVVTVSAKSSVADAIRSMHAEKVGAVMPAPRRHAPPGAGCRGWRSTAGWPSGRGAESGPRRPSPRDGTGR